MGIKNSTNTGITTQATPTSITRAGTAAGLWPVPMIAAIQADFTLAAASGVQSVFPTTYDVWTLEGNTTYLMEGQYILNTGATTHTTAMAFALGGGASIVTDGLQYTTILWSAAANTLTTTQSTTHVSGVASKVLNATSTAVYTLIQFKGLLRMNAGGTVTPQIAFSANPTGTNLAKIGTYIQFTPIGAGAFTSIGSVG